MGTTEGPVTLYVKLDVTIEVVATAAKDELGAIGRDITDGVFANAVTASSTLGV